MARRVIKKINTRLNFLWRQSIYLNYSSRRLLCNALIQTYFAYGCTSWYPLLSRSLKPKLKIDQNKCIRFCLEFPSLVHINPFYFWKINWLLVESRLELCTSTIVFKYWKGIAPSYLNDMFMHALNNYNTRSQIKGQKMLFRGPKI